MFTPQEIQEKTFTKAVFGGYDMQTVDDFLEPLTEDYITLYKENAVLKSKMKVLVEKLEEYRSQEQSMRKAILSAQRTADAMVAEAEKKCARLMHEAAGSVQVRSGEADAAIAQEQERVNCAKNRPELYRGPGAGYPRPPGAARIPEKPRYEPGAQYRRPEALRL